MSLFFMSQPNRLKQMPCDDIEIEAKLPLLVCPNTYVISEHIVWKLNMLYNSIRSRFSHEFSKQHSKTFYKSCCGELNSYCVHTSFEHNVMTKYVHGIRIIWHKSLYIRIILSAHSDKYFVCIDNYYYGIFSINKIYRLLNCLLNCNVPALFEYLENNGFAHMGRAPEIFVTKSTLRIPQYGEFFLDVVDYIEPYRW